jgi:hypothetical protein
MLVLSYSDFGPPVIATEVLGNEWWQWQSHGDSRPRQYTVKVVVYRAGELESAMVLYPVNAELEKDYRYLEYETALSYLNAKIDDDIIESVTQGLKRTKLQLICELGK